jgi:hypothetical protein
MGYSICVVAKSAKAKATMMAFMAEHFRPFDRVSGIGDSQFFRGPTDDMSYCHGQLKLGFDYSGLSGPQRKYVFGLVYWMALRIGRKVSVTDHNKQTHSLALCNYDSQSCWPVIPQDSDVPREFLYNGDPGVRVDPHGWSWSDDDERSVVAFNNGEPYVENGKTYPNPHSRDEFNRVHEELKRLSALWEQAHTAPQQPRTT